MADKALHPWPGPTTLISPLSPLLIHTPATLASLVFLEHGTPHLSTSMVPAFSVFHILPHLCLAHTPPSQWCLSQFLQTSPCLPTLLFLSLSLLPCSVYCFFRDSKLLLPHISSCPGGHDKLPQNTEVYISSQFWKLEIQNQRSLKFQGGTLGIS